MVSIPSIYGGVLALVYPGARSMFLFGVVMTWLGCSPLGEKYSVHQSGYNFIILSENFKKPISIMFSMKYTTV